MAVFCLIVAACTAGCTTNPDSGQEKKSLDGTLTIHGSTALSPAMGEQALAFTVQYPDTQVEVTGSTSNEAIYYLISGKCDMAPSARVPTTAEYNDAKSVGKTLHMTVVGYDGIAVIVNSQNPVSNLSKDQLKKIFFNGTITKWDQIPGSGKTGPINIYVQEPKTSASAEVFVSKVAPGTPFAASAIVVPGSTSEILTKKILADPDGLTFASTVFVYPNMKALPIDGVSPKPATLRDSTYPLSRTLYVITDGKPEGLKKEFLNFMFSEAGRKIATDKGIVTV
jgi:phosphate transport system substrate-binding protein